MIFLDENGVDRLIIGEGPDPQVYGKTLPRIAHGIGLLIHDDKGTERGGFSWLSDGRAVIALDRPDQDGWAAIVDDRTGFAGMAALYSTNVAPRNSTGVLIGTQGNKAFIRIKDPKDSDRAVLELEGVNEPSLKTFDAAGRPIRDLLRPSSIR